MSRSAAARKPTSPVPVVAPRPAVKVPAVLYARVSSRDQEKEGFSIPAQQKLLRSYADDKGYRIEQEFTDVETAKRAGRTNFGKMLAWLKKNKTCKVVLVEKTDRLYRNLKDWVEIDGMDLEIHLVKEAVVLSDSSRSHEKFIHGIKVLMAKNYIDNLSEEVKKGMLEKAEQGLWPAYAPFGYLNVSLPNGKRGLGLDPERAGIAKRMYEQYASGRYTLKELEASAAAAGVRTKRGAPLRIPTIHIMLKNPLYKAEFFWDGTWYPAAHPALVTSEMWDRVQDIMAGRGTTHPAVQRHQFAFNGLVTCGICADFDEQRLLVGEIQKKKYVYYHCAGCQRAGRKPRFYREDEIAGMFAGHLASLRIDTLVLDFLKGALRDSLAEKQRFQEAATTRFTKQIAHIQRKLDILYEDRLDGRLTVAQYEEKANQLREESAHARHELDQHAQADRAYTEEGIALLELAGMAFDLWESQEAPEKRRLLDFLCLNSELRSDGLHVTWKKPFDGLAKTRPAPVEGADVFDGSEEGRLMWWGRRDLNSQVPRYGGF